MISQYTTQEDTITQEKLIAEKQYALILFNDDINTFEHVIECLVKICNHQLLQAEQCAYLVHYTGKCVIKNGSYEKLEPLCSALLDSGLIAKIEK